MDELCEIPIDLMEDNRGWSFTNQEAVLMKNYALPKFVQTNYSFSRPNVIRGLHFQRAPYEQEKLLTILKGSALHVAVDLRLESGTFGHVSYNQLSTSKRTMMYVPAGFANGIATFEEVYLSICTSCYFNAQAASGIRWNCPDLKIDWQVLNPIVSDRDQTFMGIGEYFKSGNF